MSPYRSHVFCCPSTARHNYPHFYRETGLVTPTSAVLPSFLKPAFILVAIRILNAPLPIGQVVLELTVQHRPVRKLQGPRPHAQVVAKLAFELLASGEDFQALALPSITRKLADILLLGFKKEYFPLAVAFVVDPLARVRVAVLVGVRSKTVFLPAREAAVVTFLGMEEVGALAVVEVFPPRSEVYVVVRVVLDSEP